MRRFHFHQLNSLCARGWKGCHRFEGPITWSLIFEIFDEKVPASAPLTMWLWKPLYHRFGFITLIKPHSASVLYCKEPKPHSRGTQVWLPPSWSLPVARASHPLFFVDKGGIMTGWWNNGSTAPVEPGRQWNLLSFQFCEYVCVCVCVCLMHEKQTHTVTSPVRPGKYVTPTMQNCSEHQTRA